MNLLKNLRPLFLAILLISGIEILLYSLIGKETIKSSVIENTLFDNQFKKSDVPQKYLIKYKHELFSGYKSEFIQIGDSSGLYGVRPNIVNEYLDGMNYLNTNCCADIGWKGFAITGNYFLRKSPNAKYLVFYFTPYFLPTPFNQENELTKDIKGIYQDNLNNDFFKFFNYLPSQALRKNVLDFAFLNKKSNQNPREEHKEIVEKMRLSGFYKKYTGFEPEYLFESLTYHKGWMPLDIQRNVNSDFCGPGISDTYFGKYKKGMLTSGLNMINDVAKKNKVKLLVIFNPVACKESEKLIQIEEELKFFKKENPKIIFINDLITTINKENFVDNEHLNPLAAIENSRFIGAKIRAQIINMNYD